MARLNALALKVPFISDIRGLGLMIGIEIVNAEGKPDAKLTNHLANVAQERGLLMRTSLYGYGNVLKIRPALVMTQSEADEMMDILEPLMLDVAGGRA